MTERPIIFSGPMVRAILDGRKTMTRRVIKPQPVGAPKNMEIRQHQCGLWMPWIPDVKYYGWCETPYYRCPYGPVGGRLWVRETWARCHPALLQHLDPDPNSSSWFALYRADGVGDSYIWDYGVKWRPSIHMPRWASRITLEVTGVRVERVQDITEEDAVAEGVDSRDDTARRAFAMLWDSINAKRGFGWEDNPWVWVIEFRRVDQ